MIKARLITILGTRPEIIRLSRIIPRLDKEFDHILVHTSQNFDPLLSEIFFEELQIRRPDYFFDVTHESLAKTISDILIKTEELIHKTKPQGLFVLGDTNSAMAAIIAKRMQIPVYHWEAGNRSFDENVPEETNRKIVDHVSHFNIAYTEHASTNLINEGISKDRVIVSGSPLAEVLDHYKEKIFSSQILEKHFLKEKGFFVASFHRQETVDSPERLRMLLSSLSAVQRLWQLPIIVSTHPRTRLRLDAIGLQSAEDFADIRFVEPLGYFDYMKLQITAKCVLSDSGTISEESAILDFPAVTIRDSMERPEALESNSIVMTGLRTSDIVGGINWALSERSHQAPISYLQMDAASKVVNLIKETITTYDEWSGVRKIK